LSERAPTPPRFIGQSTWISRMGFKRKRFGMRVLTNSTMRGTAVSGSSAGTAAFMASGFAKHTGQLGVCVGTTGPGAVHLLDGLYDANMDGSPVVAITGMTFHDLIGTRYQQGVDTTKLMQDVALYNVEVTGPEHAVLVTNRACRVALGDRGVAHLTVSKDTQMMRLATDKRSMGNPGACRPSSRIEIRFAMRSSPQT
jgi:thiamine pyrophosphate-dependent acetolactate synthase large subunit-like protein